MAGLSPYLRLLLAKRGTNAQPLDTPASADPATGNIQPVNPAPSVAPTTNLDPLIQVQSRTPLESAQDDVRRYDAGLHPDAEYPAIWTPRKRNRLLQTLEGIGTVAASGVGVDLQRILHPRGTPEQQAHRRLRDETAMQGVELQKRRANTEDASKQSSIALRNRQIAEMDKPDVPADLHVGERVLRKRADGGYETVYEPPAKPDKEQPGFSLSPGEARFDHTGKLITERAPRPDKEDDAPDATGALGELEGGFRANEQAARTKAEQLESEVETAIAQKSADKNYDPSNDAHVQRLIGEAKRQRDIETDQRKRADDTAADKVKAGSKRKGGAAKASGQRWSKSRWAAANQGADVAAAVKEAQRRGLQVVE